MYESYFNCKVAKSAVLCQAAETAHQEISISKILSSFENTTIFKVIGYLSNYQYLSYQLVKDRFALLECIIRIILNMQKLEAIASEIKKFEVSQTGETKHQVY